MYRFADCVDIVPVFQRIDRFFFFSVFSFIDTLKDVRIFDDIGAMIVEINYQQQLFPKLPNQFEEEENWDAGEVVINNIELPHIEFINAMLFDPRED